MERIGSGRMAGKAARIIAFILICVLITGFRASKDEYNAAHTDPGEHIEKTALVSDSKGADPIPASPGSLQKVITTEIDMGNYSDLDSGKRNWGVVLNQVEKQPEIPEEIRRLLGRYNAWYAANPDVPVLYLIFSASYDNENMSRILDALKLRNVKAVFYLVGDFVRAYPELVARIIQDGHAIGNHSSSHRCLPLVSDELLFREVVEYHDYVKTRFNYEMRYFMPPSGEYSEKVLALAAEMGYITQFWSFAYKDFDPSVRRGADYAFSKVIQHLHNGSFLFLHTVSFDNADAIGRTLDFCLQRGYTFDLFLPPSR
ncbi:MAG TPA: polysaccharide deacetylase [Clostridiales bacterium]|nr:polysaccharide deacetylase [Clostridiales bacterium]